MPGFVNAHCHAAMTFERGWAEDLPFDRWLNEKIWVMESALTPDDVYWGSALAACEMIRSGTVAFNDHYFYMDRAAEVVEQSGMKAALTWCVFGIGQGAEVGPGLEGTVEWIKAAHGSAGGRIRTFLGPHSPYICPRDFLEKIVQHAHDLGQGIHIHLAEDDEQVRASLAKYGLRPVQFLDQLGAFEAPGGLVGAHCLSIDVTDTEIMAAKGVHAAHCPITYMKLAMPFPPLGRRLKAGVRVCLGTDGPGSNSDMDMFATVRQTALMAKYQALDPEAVPGDMPLRLATQAGARALGFEGAGALTVGAPADLILVNLDAPHLRPIHSLVANLVHSAKGADVTDVMVDGRWLMRDRALLTLDEEKILREAEAHAQAMMRRGMGQVREYKG
jgi:5-methylthioadenosine/S-adenosylhomocysteine deaminase